MLSYAVSLNIVYVGKNYATGKIGSPLDYVGFHAKGGPRVIDNRVQMNIGRQLLNISKGFEAVASFPGIETSAYYYRRI